MAGVGDTKPLFPWDELEVSPTLGTIRDALRTIPDAALLGALRKRRHNGCDTYPVSVLVSAVRIVHLGFATLLAQAQRKEGSFGTLRLSSIAKKLQELIVQEASASPRLR